jgi:hypothetical protein
VPRSAVGALQQGSLSRRPMGLLTANIVPKYLQSSICRFLLAELDHVLAVGYHYFRAFRAGLWAHRRLSADPCPGGLNEMGQSPVLTPALLRLVTKSAGLEAGKVPTEYERIAPPLGENRPVYTPPPKAAL